MTTHKTNRLATPEEVEQINKDAEEAELLYFQSGLADVPMIVDAKQRSSGASAAAGTPPPVVEVLVGEVGLGRDANDRQ